MCEMGEKREDIVVVVSHGMVLEVVVVVVPEFDKDSRNSQRAMSLFSARVSRLVEDIEVIVIMK